MRRLIQQPDSLANAFVGGASQVARWAVIPMAGLAFWSSRYAIRPLEPLFLFGGFFVAGVLLGGFCSTAPLIWQGIVHRWFGANKIRIAGTRVAVSHGNVSAKVQQEEIRDFPPANWEYFPVLR